MLLCIGATGGGCSFATQLAAASGICVIATARADAQHWIRDLGATDTIDYGEHQLVDALAATQPGGIDALLDLVVDQQLFTAAARHARDGGAAVSNAFGVPHEFTGQQRITASNYTDAQKPALLERVSRRVALGRLAV